MTKAYLRAAAMTLVSASLLAHTSAPTGAAPAVAPVDPVAATAVHTAHKGRIDVDVKAINKRYAYYGESYTDVEVRAYYRKSRKPIANGTVALRITIYPKGWRLNEYEEWVDGGPGANSVTRNVTAQLNNKGVAKFGLGENCRYCALPPLNGARTTSTGAVSLANGTYLGSDTDSVRKKVVQRVVKGDVL